jgi:hypothetical protein
VKGYRDFDIWMETLVHWASQCSSFQSGSLGVIGRNWQIDIYLKLQDPANWLLNHRFHHFDLSAFHRDRMTLCEAAHDCRHTTSKRGSYEIGRRKRRSLASIVERERQS